VSKVEIAAANLSYSEVSIASTKGTSLYDHYRQAYQAHRNLKRRHEKALLIEVKKRYKKEQSMIDIQRQLKEFSIAE